jgi:hypothetical protein
VKRLLLGAAFLAAAGASGQPAPPAAGVTEAARKFLQALRPALRAECVLAVEDGNRLEWSYLPGRREGVSLDRMNEAERQEALAILRAALSVQGYEKAEGVRELERVLRDLETFGSLRRDPEAYYLTIFGSPSDAKPWAWRFEGHHLSINFSSATGRIVSETPAFYGANPARVPEGSRRGWRLLAAEEDLARQLLAGLDPRQRGLAVLPIAAPADIILGVGRGKVPEPAGIAYAELSAAQQRILMDLVGVYLGNLREDVAAVQRGKIGKAGLDRVRFAWAGGTAAGEGHYYRIQGPTFVIEYDNTQNHANHVHSVYRDLEDDFGGDLLRRHYAESRHHRDARPATLSGPLRGPTGIRGDVSSGPAPSEPGPDFQSPLPRGGGSRPPEADLQQ